MNPLEAMARRVHGVLYPTDAWEDTHRRAQALCFEVARAALDALADNIDTQFVRFDFSTSATKLDENRFRAAIRAAGEN